MIGWWWSGVVCVCQVVSNGLVAKGEGSRVVCVVMVVVNVECEAGSLIR